MVMPIGTGGHMHPLPPGWRSIEWIEPPGAPQPRAEAPDMMMAAFSSLLPHAAVDKMKKAAEAHRIADELNRPRHAMYQTAEQRVCTLCPKCAAVLDGRIGRFSTMGQVPVPMTEIQPVVMIDPVAKSQ